MYGRAKRIVRERRCLRRQDLEGSFLVYWRRRQQATGYGHERQQQADGSHKIEQAIDA
jgi:hypothetical protein